MIFFNKPIHDSHPYYIYRYNTEVNGTQKTNNEVDGNNDFLECLAN